MAKSERYYGTGRRKSSVARVYLVPGKGEIKINIYTEDGTVLENIVSGSFSY